MTKKEAFITIVSKEIFEKADIYKENYPEIFEDALAYFKGLQATEDKSKPKFTENGKLVLQYMKDNYENNQNIFKSKGIGEGLGISSRTVSGAMRKLVNDGYAEKIGADPVVYCITESGITVSFDE